MDRVEVLSARRYRASGHRRRSAGRRLVAAEGLRRTYHRAQRGEVAADQPERPGLHQDVPERRRLDRAGDYGQAAGVRRELAQQLVAAAAADDVDDVDVDPRKPAGVGDRASERRRQAVEDAAHERRP